MATYRLEVKEPPFSEYALVYHVTPQCGSVLQLLFDQGRIQGVFSLNLDFHQGLTFY